MTDYCVKSLFLVQFPENMLQLRCGPVLAHSTNIFCFFFFLCVWMFKYIFEPKYVFICVCILYGKICMSCPGILNVIVVILNVLIFLVKLEDLMSILTGKVFYIEPYSYHFTALIYYFDNNIIPRRL